MSVFTAGLYFITTQSRFGTGGKLPFLCKVSDMNPAYRWRAMMQFQTQKYYQNIISTFIFRFVRIFNTY